MDLGSFLTISSPFSDGNPISSPLKQNICLRRFGLRLPQLPTKFYDAIVLAKIGNKIGRLIKIDACTSSTLLGRYARLCVELPIDKPVLTHIFIGSHRQQILYEGENFLCTNCGKLRHIAGQCSLIVNSSNHSHNTPNAKEKEPTSLEEWQTVSFSSRRRSSPKKVPSTPCPAADSGINVKLLDANTDKYLTTQMLTYKNKKFHNTDNIKNNSSNNNVHNNNFTNMDEKVLLKSQQVPIGPAHIPSKTTMDDTLPVSTIYQFPTLSQP
ncbi:uncharacterized protein LOC132041789 [Lycium ferocissimum]|uniref:uncharacterized protein LOC132041789 n=1 Tax=Lycium ferocissimum TaxID=112874 RepID=UPI002814C2CE|nr:uncharacterized protein LOC132041789 [Lycium ferocissimum]